MRAQHIEIRNARADDLYGLVQSLGQWSFFIDRFYRQQTDRGELLTAWSLAGHALGAVYLWLEPADEPEIRTHLPGVPLLTHLEVPPDHRNRGVGTKLVAATEHSALDLGRDHLALAVKLGNADAERFYRRLGYHRWDHGEVPCVDKFGNHGVEICDIYLKTLAWSRLPAPRSESVLSRSS